MPVKSDIATAEDPALTVDLVTTFEGFLGLAREWEELLCASRLNIVFLTHEWFRCWWEAFSGDSQLYIVCVRKRGRLVGIAPLHLMKARFRRLPVRKLSLMANASSGDADFIVTAPYEPILSAIFDYLAGCSGVWDLLELPRVRHDSPLWTHLARITHSCGLKYALRSDIEVPYISIEGDWSSFLAGRSRGFRKAHNRRRNRIKKYSDPVEIVRLSSQGDVQERLPWIFEVSSKSWKAQRGQAIVDDPGKVFFFERLSGVLASAGAVDLWIARCRENVVSFEYHVKRNGVTCPIRADFDESYRLISPGAHLEYTIIESLYNDPVRAVREYNTCADGYAYELRWTNTVRSHGLAWVFAPSWYRNILYPLGRLRRHRYRKPREPAASCRSES